MKILVCGEGKHDIGKTDFWCERTGDYVELEGWMQPLIRSIKGEDITMSTRRRADLVLLPREQGKYKPLPEGHGARALVAKRTAVLGGFDAVIYMADADTTSVKRWREIKKQILDGFSRITDPLPSIACVPMSASESWLLADGNAWENVTGNKQELPKKPETIWGQRDDPKGNHPHRIFARICNECGRSDDRDLRVAIVEAANIATLLSQCPTSFAPFHSELDGA